jgi:hypothetical protein
MYKITKKKVNFISLVPGIFLHVFNKCKTET